MGFIAGTIFGILLGCSWMWCKYNLVKASEPDWIDHVKETGL